MHSCMTMKALNAPKKPVKKERVFYKTTITVTVLSEDKPIDESWDLKDIEHEMSYGNLVGETEISKQTKLTPKQTVKALFKMGSQPEFFELDDKGRSTFE